jgi:hypothetical protein
MVCATAAAAVTYDGVVPRGPPEAVGDRAFQ